MTDAPSAGAAASEPVGAVVVRESAAQRNFLYGFLTVASVVALVRGLLGGPSGWTVVALVAVFAVLVIVLAAWWKTWRDPYRIEVSVERLRYRGRNRDEYDDIVRERGIDVLIYSRPVGRTELLVLEQAATGQEWVLRFFGRQPLVDACRARGWTITSTQRRPT